MQIGILEVSALICSFILERSCTHVDSVTNHSLKLLLWINICFEIVLLWFVEVMVEVVLDEVTNEEVEEDIWRCLLCPWRRCWTVKEVTAGDVRPLAIFFNMTSSNIVIFLLHVLNFWHIIAMVTLPWFNYDLPFKLPWYEKKTEFWDPQLTVWLAPWHTTWTMSR